MAHEYLAPCRFHAHCQMRSISKAKHPRPDGRGCFAPTKSVRVAVVTVVAVLLLGGLVHDSRLDGAGCQPLSSHGRVNAEYLYRG